MALQIDHSTSVPLRKYDVFLSFRGEDARKDFTDHLYSALKQKGIFAFRDDEELERGEFISEKLLKAIQESEYAVVIISKNYASSKWCLKELTEIVNCKRENQLTVLPVFYHVDPSDIRNPYKGIFANAFAKYEEAFEVDTKLWSNALKEVGNIAGWHVYDRYESTIVKEICTKIFGGLNRRLSINFKDIVGIKVQVKKMISLLRVHANDVQFIGIYGMGGIGKTTLANVIFEIVHFEFEASCFVDDISEEVKKSGIVNVQRQLISKILEDRNIEIWNCNDGIRVIANRLRSKKVFIVLDNVTEVTQIEALVEGRDWFGQGSRILLTSRDKHLLKTFVDETYEVNELSDDDALRLFCLKAFKKHHPTNDYKDLSKQFVSYAKGLPLALKVFGSLLFGKGINSWMSVLEQLKVEQDSKILDKLKISFNDLSNLQKELFLDIACFFNREKVDNVIQKLESLGRHPISNIEVLKDRSLLKVFNEEFCMHDLLQEMGQQIVHGKPLANLSECSRLWCKEDILHVLKNDIGTDAIEAIFLKLPLPKPKKLSFEGFSKMKKLRMLIIRPNNDGDLSTIAWHGDHSKLMLSNELRVIEWWGYPLECLPTNFEANYLVELKMPMSNIKQLWDAKKNFEKLKYIDLRDSQNLVKMPDLSGVTNLEELNIKGTGIKQLSPSFLLLEKLNILCVGGNLSRSITFSLCGLPLCLKSVRELNLSYCNLLDGALVNVLGYLSLLEDLDLSGNKFREIGGVSQLSKLRSLRLNNCRRLKALPPNFPLSFHALELDNCPRLTTFSDPGDIWTSSEILVAGGISFWASYFGYSRRHEGIVHLSRTCEAFSRESTAIVKASVAWGPTLTSDTPEYFNQRSTSDLDISRIFQHRFDFDVNAYVEPGSVRYHCVWAYAMFIVYKGETQEINGNENSSSTMFPLFVCELQVNSKDHPFAPEGQCRTSPKVPIVFRVPEIPSDGSNGVWITINDNCFQCLPGSLSYIGSCSITISSLNVQVKECSGRLVVGLDIFRCHGIIRSISPHGLDPETLENIFGRQENFWVSGRIKGREKREVGKEEESVEIYEKGEEEEREEKGVEICEEEEKKEWEGIEICEGGKKEEREHEGVESCEEEKEEGAEIYGNGKQEEAEDEGVQICEKRDEEEGERKRLKSVNNGKRKKGLKSTLFLVCGSVFLFYRFVLKKKK